MSLLSGIVVGSSGGLYEILCGDERIFCSARGNFRSKGIRLLVGDYVDIDENERGEAFVAAIRERRNSLIRPPLANLDLLFCTLACADPEPSTVIFDKLVTIADHNAIEPVIVITKSDIAPERAAKLANDYAKCSFRTFVTSSESGDGIDEIRKYIENECVGKICAFSGSSGVGKSSLINRVCPELSLETGELSKKIARGKNTTRKADIFKLSCGAFIADTPGFSLIDFQAFDFYSLDDLPFVFREFEPYLVNCRYTKCTHRKEDGCAVRAAVDEGIIPKSRHESYIVIYDELKDKHPWDK